MFILEQDTFLPLSGANLVNPRESKAKMKLRVRSVETKETIKIDTPNPCSVEHLKTLISTRIGAQEGSILHLSFNREDEIEVDADSSHDQTIESLGIISGDLVFYSFNPFAFSELPSPPFASVGEGTSILDNKEKEIDASNLKESGEEGEGASNLDSNGAATLDPQLSGLRMDEMNLDEEELVPTRSSSFSVPGFLKRVMEEEAGIITHDFGLLMFAVHAVFMESGFVVCRSEGNSSRLPEGWASPTSPVISVSYTIPGLQNISGDAIVSPITVKFTIVGRFVNVYGSLSGCCGICRACFDVSRFAPSFRSFSGEMNEEDESRVFELWKVVKDELSLPLLIDASEKYGLPLPLCFTLLPIDIKVMILDLLPGIDLARIGCVNMEMRYLSSNDELWGKKFIEEFDLSNRKGLFGKRWKDKFAICWEKRKMEEENARRIDRGTAYGLPQSFWRAPVPFASPRFNIIGGDYDCFPAFGGGPNGSGLDIPQLLPRRNFSPRCNFDVFRG